MARPFLWIIAGPNGAGKTTTIQRKPVCDLISEATFLNPDDRALALLRQGGFSGFADAPAEVQRAAFIEAAEGVELELHQIIDRGGMAGIETVLSTPKYRAVVEKVRNAGGIVFLIYVSLKSPAVSAQRVQTRVQLGGHGVPLERIADRWRKSLDQLQWFAAQAHAFLIYDNSDSNSEQGPILLAQKFHDRATDKSQTTFHPEFAKLATAEMVRALGYRS